MVDCSQFLDEYSDFRDGLLTSERMQSFQVHLDQCSSCSRYDRVVDQGTSVFRSLPELEPSPDFALRLQHRLFHLEEEMRAPSRHSSGTSIAFTLAIAAVIGVSAWMPAMRARPSVVQLPPAVAHAPHHVEMIQVLFRPAPLMSPAPAQPSAEPAAANLLFYRYSPVGSFIAQPTSYSFAH